MRLLKDESKKKRVTKIIMASIIAVAFVPVLYSGIYLAAFWDPYGKFSNVPVAFVNLDKPFSKDNKVYNIGKDIENNLKENTKVDWKFMDYNTAKQGVDGTKYYAMITIPEDFSEKIANSQNGKIIRPEITYEANSGRNFVFAQVSERAAESIKSEVASNIQGEVTKALGQSLYDIKNALLDASKGAGDLKNGIQSLLDGSVQLSDGINQAANGSKLLQDGLRQASTGEAQLLTGMDSLNDGLNQFKSSLTQNTSDVSKLVNGSNSVAQGVSAASNGANNANNLLSKNLSAAADGVLNISNAINQANTILNTSTDAQSVAQVKAILNQLAASNISQNIETPLRASANSLKPLADSLNVLKGASQQVAVGVSTLAAGLSDTQSKAVQGVNQLLAGVESLKTGGTQIQNGLNTAVNKTGELSVGLNQLNSGAITLTNGLSEANNGSLKLRDGLDKGYNDISSGLKLTVEELSDFVTNPLTLSDKSINKVKYYGEGLAPYFISLSLWLGAMLMNLILSILKFTNIVEHKFYRRYTGAFVAGAILVAWQALILSLELTTVLGLKPSNLPLFFLCNMFISVVFFTIMYAVGYAIGIIGTPIMFVVFILQLASSGGTFPIETAPTFFRDISYIFPMTYTVEGLRMIISGINSSRLSQIIMILAIFMAAFFAGGYLYKEIRKRVVENSAEEE